MGLLSNSFDKVKVIFAGRTGEAIEGKIEETTISGGTNVTDRLLSDSVLRVIVIGTGPLISPGYSCVIHCIRVEVVDSI